MGVVKLSKVILVMDLESQGCEHEYVTYQEFPSIQTVFVDFRKK